MKKLCALLLISASLCAMDNKVTMLNQIEKTLDQKIARKIKEARQTTQYAELKTQYKNLKEDELKKSLDKILSDANENIRNNFFSSIPWYINFLCICDQLKKPVDPINSTIRLTDKYHSSNSLFKEFDPESKYAFLKEIQSNLLYDLSHTDNKHFTRENWMLQARLLIDNKQWL